MWLEMDVLGESPHLLQVRPVDGPQQLWHRLRDGRAVNSELPDQFLFGGTELVQRVGSDRPFQVLLELGCLLRWRATSSEQR